MPLDPSRFLDARYPEKTFRYTDRDTMLYGLVAGMAADPLDREELAFVCEPRPRVLPSQATVIAWDYSFIEGSGIDEVRILHGAQSVTIHRPLPPEATITSQFRVTDIHDKGPGKGAVIIAETRIFDQASGDHLCTNVWTSYARGEGGFGGDRGPKAETVTPPERAPDFLVETATQRNHPLFYRLLGDVNPLHSDPDIAAEAGFDRPIMHGLNTYAIVCRALVVTVCGYRPERLDHYRCQFAAPVYPGETIQTRIWRDGPDVAFTAHVPERGIDVVTGGRATLAQT